MSSVIVTVTREDIENGERQAITACPVALACLRVIGDRFRSAHYSGFEMSNGYLGDWPSSEVPLWMRWFDEGTPVEPFEFELQVQP